MDTCLHVCWCMGVLRSVEYRLISAVFLSCSPCDQRPPICVVRPVSLLPVFFCFHLLNAGIIGLHAWSAFIQVPIYTDPSSVSYAFGASVEPTLSILASDANPTHLASVTTLSLVGLFLCFVLSFSVADEIYDLIQDKLICIPRPSEELNRNYLLLSPVSL